MRPMTGSMRSDMGCSSGWCSGFWNTVAPGSTACGAAAVARRCLKGHPGPVPRPAGRNSGARHERPSRPVPPHGGAARLRPDHLLSSIANIFAWTWTGYNTIVLVSALRSVPADLYEAARVDGATPLQLVRFIKLPLLAPTLTLVALFALIAVLQLFTEPFVLKSLSFVPTSLTPTLYIYTTAFGYGNFNYASALATLVALLSFALSAGLLLLINRQRQRA